MSTVTESSKRILNGLQRHEKIGNDDEQRSVGDVGQNLIGGLAQIGGLIDMQARILATLWQPWGG